MILWLKQEKAVVTTNEVAMVTHNENIGTFAAREKCMLNV